MGQSVRQGNSIAVIKGFSDDARKIVVQSLDRQTQIVSSVHTALPVRNAGFDSSKNTYIKYNNKNNKIEISKSLITFDDGSVWTDGKTLNHDDNRWRKGSPQLIASGSYVKSTRSLGQTGIYTGMTTYHSGFLNERGKLRILFEDGSGVEDDIEVVLTEATFYRDRINPGVSKRNHTKKAKDALNLLSRSCNSFFVVLGIKESPCINKPTPLGEVASRSNQSRMSLFMNSALMKLFRLGTQSSLGTVAIAPTHSNLAR